MAKSKSKSPAEQSFTTAYGFSMTPSDHYALKQAMAGEARNQGVEGMQAVGNVIMNRMIDGRFAPTISKIVSAPKQFSYYRDHNRAKADALLASDSPLAKQIESIAKSLEQGIASDLTNGATGYHAYKPGAGANMSDWQKEGMADPGKLFIGDHVFYNNNVPSRERIAAAYSPAPVTEAGMASQRSSLLDAMFGVAPSEMEMQAPELAAATAKVPEGKKYNPLDSIKANLAQSSVGVPPAVRAQREMQGPELAAAKARAADPLASIKAHLVTTGVGTPPSVIAREAEAARAAVMAGRPVTPAQADLAAIGEKLSALPMQGADLAAAMSKPRPSAITPGYAPAAPSANPLSAPEMMGPELAAAMSRPRPSAITPGAPALSPPTAAPPTPSLSAPTPEMMSRQAELAGLGAPSVTGMPGAPPSFGEPVTGVNEPSVAARAPAVAPTSPTLSRAVPTTSIPTPSIQENAAPAAPSLPNIGQSLLASPRPGAEPASPLAQAAAAAGPEMGSNPLQSDPNLQAALSGIQGGFAAEPALPAGPNPVGANPLEAGPQPAPDLVSTPQSGLPGAFMTPESSLDWGSTAPPTTRAMPAMAPAPVAPPTAVPTVAPAVAPPSPVKAKPGEEPAGVGDPNSYVTGSGVFDPATGKQVGVIDAEGKAVGMPGLGSALWGGLKGAMKMSPLGLGGMLFGGARGFANTGYGAPQSKFNLETASLNDVMGKSGYMSGKAANNILGQVNSMNLGKAPEGYHYGYSPFGAGIALVSENAPAHVQIASSGSGFLGALFGKSGGGGFTNKGDEGGGLSGPAGMY